MGKPIEQARAEVAKCIGLLRHYAEFSEAYLEPRMSNLGAGRTAELEHAPLGPLLSITPWNFPYWQALRFAVPALAAGNVIFNKPAPNVIGCAQALCDVMRDDSVPAGVFQSLALANAQSAAAIHDDRICGVALTGSELAGAAVACEAGRAIKKVVLELGGSDPFVVLGDADVERAAAAGVTSRFANSGQVCIAAKRFIVEKDVFDDFCEAFAAEVEAMKIGDPTEEDVFVGPMARADIRDRLEIQRRAIRDRGADCLIEGGAADARGFYFRPSVWVERQAAERSFEEEVFGPLAIIVCVRDAEEAVSSANDSRFGLSASVWSQDLTRARAVAKRLVVGGVFINEIPASDARLPFGGVKKSGFGRELGADGVWEFCNLKSTVYSMPA
jgi:succinate-semialdehyde dehydrogenase